MKALGASIRHKKSGLFLFLGALLLSDAGAQQPLPSREYIRVGGQVIAIENSSYTVSISAQNNIYQIGALDTLTFTESNSGCTGTCTVSWTVDNPAAASIASSTATTAILTPVSTLASPVTVSVTAKVGSVSSAQSPINIFPVFTPSSANFGASGGGGGISVFKLGTWTGHSNAGWLHITSPVPDANGNITVSSPVPANVAYSVDPNTTGTAQTGSLTLAGTTFTVNESASGGAPTLSISPSTINVTGISGSTSFQVTSQNSAPWSIQTSWLPSWIHLTASEATNLANTQTTSQAVTILYDPNPSPTTSRQGTVCLVSGPPPCPEPYVVVTQSAGLSFSPSSGSLGAGSSGTTVPGSVSVTAPAATSWTASVDSGSQAWLSITSGASGTGNGTVNYQALANGGYASRTGTIYIGGTAYSVTQSGASRVVVQPGFWSFSVTGTKAFTATDGNGNFLNANWSLSPGYGSISPSSGTSTTYTAPGSAPTGVTDYVKATDPNSGQYSTAQVLLNYSGGVGGLQVNPNGANGNSINFQQFQVTVPSYFGSSLESTMGSLQLLFTENTGAPFSNTANSCYISMRLQTGGAFNVLLADNAADGGNENGNLSTSSGQTSFGVLANSQCEVDLTRSYWQQQGGTSNLWVVLAIYFRPGWRGNSNVYMQSPSSNPPFYAAQYGVWTSPGYSAPQVGITTDNETVSGKNQQILGWALDNPNGPQTPISKVELYADGVDIGPATLHQTTPAGVTNYCNSFPSQTDIYNNPILPGWDCPNFGWSYIWDTTKLSNGNHTLTAVATDSDPSPLTASAPWTYNVNNPLPVAPPVFGTTPGTYTSSQSVTLTSTTAGASIRYTTDGSAPSETVGTLYSGPILITATTTLKAIAYATSMTDSPIVAGTYVISSSGVSWYNTSWPYRKAITLDHTKVVGGTTLTNFPVLISIADPNLATTANGGGVGRSDGSDILFTDSTGTLQLNHQIETYNGNTGQLIAWVQVPSVLASSDTLLYVYYGNSSAANQNPTAVWDGSFQSVWHLTDNAANTSVLDSTANNNSGVSVANTNTKSVAGIFASALTFNGSGDYIHTSTSYNNPASETIEAWFNAYPGAAGGTKIIGFEINQLGTESTAYDRQIWVGTDGKVYGGFYTCTFPGSLVSGSTYNDGAWHIAALTLDTSMQQAQLYVDGQQVGSTATCSSASSYTGYWRIGSYKLASWTNANNGYFSGLIQEVRISSTARGAGWIGTEYNNEKSPQTFLIVDGQEGGQLATPVFSPTGGNYTSAQTVTITSTPGASINYTTDGSAPSSTNGILYTGAISITNTTTLRAIAYTTGANSAIGTATYAFPPTAPTNLTTSPGNAQVALAWTASVGAATYNIKRSTTSGGPYSLISSGITGTSYTDTGVSNGTTYYYVVCAVNSAGESASSSQASALPSASTVGTPNFTPSAGTYTTNPTVSVFAATPGAAIRYTTDGSTPSETVGTIYTAPITISSTTTLKAIAYESGMLDSVVASATYTIAVATPTFSPVSGTYSSSQNVTLSTATSGGSIYYTTDGSTPTTSSMPYTGAISVTRNTTINALGIKAGLTNSAVAAASYTISAAAPTFSYPAGLYSGAVQLSTTTPGAQIRYTTDGTAPTTSSTLYTAAGITLTHDTTIAAIALNPGINGTSPVVSSTYVFKPTVPSQSISGSGAVNSFSVNVNDVNGTAAISQVLVAITNGSNQCVVGYGPASTSFFLQGASGALQPLQTGFILSGTYCALTTPNQSVSANQLTLTLPIAFKSAFSGSTQIAAEVIDLNGQNSGWVSIGSWTVPASYQAPNSFTLSPMSGSGMSATFTATYHDPNGAANIYFADLMVVTNFPFSTDNCTVGYSSGFFLIANDDGTGWQTDGSGNLLYIVAGGSGSISNSKCTLTGPTVTYSSTDLTQLTITVPVTFSSGFSMDSPQTKQVRMYAQDYSGTNSGWTLVNSATWTVQ